MNKEITYKQFRVIQLLRESPKLKVGDVSKELDYTLGVARDLLYRLRDRKWLIESQRRGVRLYEVSAAGIAAVTAYQEALGAIPIRKTG